MPSRFFTSGRKFSTSTSALLGQPLEGCDAFRRLEIQRHAALVAVQVLKIRAVVRAAHRLRSPAALDLDDIGAPVGELPHAGRAGAHPRQIEHRETRKRLRGTGKRHRLLLLQYV